ncbi:MAG: hypothetical protein AAF291_16985 [Pseudomonadota bacterium]
MTLRIAFPLAAVFALAGCSVDEISISPNPPTTPPVQNPPTPAPFTPSLPRLASGPHLGMITGFDPLSDEQADEAALRYEQARASGASVGRVQIDWGELETAPGEYDEEALIDAFADPGLEGMNVVVLLSTLDSDGLTVPDYLVEDGALRDGLTLASPQLVDAFSGFLDWLGPQLMARDVWLLSIANEPKGPVEDGLASEQDAVTFYSEAMDQWNAAHPEIGITATFTIAAPQGIPDFFEAVRARADIVSFNYYCLTGEIQVTGQADWEARLAQMKADAGGREIFMQELGCPVGYSPQARPTFIGGSLENQVAFFEFFGEAFATDPQLRAATMFQLYDWSPELASQFGDSLRDQGFPVLGDRLEEWLATSGFLRWEDSFERPAWQTWRAQLERLKAARAD